jgi:hypothetical protein
MPDSLGERDGVSPVGGRLNVQAVSETRRPTTGEVAGGQRDFWRGAKALAVS